MADDRQTAVEAWLKERWNDAQVVASLPTVETLLRDEVADPREQRDHVARVLASIKGSYQYVGVYVLNGRGETVISASGSPPVAPACLAAVRAVAQDKIQETIFYRSARTGKPRIGVIRPVELAPSSPGTQTAGWVVLVMDPGRWLYPMLLHQSVPTASAETLLVRRESGRFLFLSPLRHTSAVPLTFSLPEDIERIAARGAVEGQRSFGPYVDYRRVPILASTRRIEGTDWGLVAKVDEDEALAIYREKQTLALAAAAGLLLAFLGLAYSLWRRQRMNRLKAVLAEHERSESALRESERKLVAVLNATPFPIALVDPQDNNIYFWSQSAQALFGHTAPTASEWYEIAYPDPDYRREVIERWGPFVERARSSGQAVNAGEYRVTCRNGSVRHCELHAAFLADSLVVTFNDITGRKRTDEELTRHREHLEELVRERTVQLEAANEELEAFSYSVSHDLRAPLRAIDGFSGALVEDYGDRLDEEGRRLIAVVRSSTRQMSQLIDDLLTFSRVGRHEMGESRVSMEGLARTVFEEAARAAGRDGIRLELGKLPDAPGDATLLGQVWTNLIGNAVKYSAGRNPAVIQISGHATNGEQVYSVKDNGVGFDMDYVGKLFGVFQRLHTSKEFEGTGVGLAIVKRIVVRHGGRVWAESAPGGGATFHFALPEKGVNGHDRE